MPEKVKCFSYIKSNSRILTVPGVQTPAIAGSTIMIVPGNFILSVN